MTNPHRLLIVEWQGGGHQAFHISHLVSYLLAERPDLEVVFALRPNLVALLPAEAHKALEDPEVTRCALKVLPAGGLPELRAKSSLFRGVYDVVRGLREWGYAQRLARRLQVSHVHLHYFDHSLLGAALPFRSRGRPTVSGLLFRPSVHYSSLNKETESSAERRRNRLKSWLYRRVLSNPRLTAAFAFDRYFGEFAAGRFEDGAKVIFVPDPAPKKVDDPAAPASDGAAARVSFLLFGALSRRKGVLAVLAALSRLSDEVAARCRVRFAGGVDPAIREIFYASLKQLQAGGTSAEIDVDDRYLGDDEIVAMVRDADVIFAPYQRHVGSSGVLYWAAAAGKPVITQDYGLVGREARDFHLGLAVDTQSPESLAGAITTAVRAGGRDLACPDGQARYIDGHGDADFAAALIEGMAPRRRS